MKEARRTRNLTGVARNQPTTYSVQEIILGKGKKNSLIVNVTSQNVMPSFRT